MPRCLWSSTPVGHTALFPDLSFFFLSGYARDADESGQQLIRYPIADLREIGKALPESLGKFFLGDLHELRSLAALGEMLNRVLKSLPSQFFHFFHP